MSLFLVTQPRATAQPKNRQEPSFLTLNKVATVQTKTANTEISLEEQQTGAVTTFDDRTSSLEPIKTRENPQALKVSSNPIL